MYRLELFAKVIVALVLVYALTDGGAYLSAEAHYFKLVVEALFQHTQPFGHVVALEHALLDLVAQRQGVGGEVYVFVGVGAPVQAGYRILGEPVFGRGDVAHYVLCSAEIRLFQREVAVGGSQLVRLGEEAAVEGETAHAHTAKALGEDAHAVRGQARDLLYFDHRAHAADVLRRYFVLFRLRLGADEQLHIVFRSVLDRGERNEPAGVERYSGVREYHPAAQSDHRYAVEIFYCHVILPYFQNRGSARSPDEFDDRSGRPRENCSARQCAPQRGGKGRFKQIFYR